MTASDTGVTDCRPAFAAFDFIEPLLQIDRPVVIFGGPYSNLTTLVWFSERSIGLAGRWLRPAG